MKEYCEEVAERKLNMEHWVKGHRYDPLISLNLTLVLNLFVQCSDLQSQMDGDKWDRAGSFNEVDFLPQFNNTVGFYLNGKKL